MTRHLWLVLFVLAAGRLSAQGVPPGTAGPPAPDCFFSSGSSGGATATGKYGPNGGSNTFFDNTVSQCAIWHLVYVATSGASSISIELDGANAGATFGTPGSFAALTGLAYGSTNPSTVTGGSDIAAAPTVVPAYVQVNLGTLNAGTVRWWAIGYRPAATTTPGTGFGQFVLQAPLAALLSGQQAVTNAAAALATTTIKTICVKNLLTSTASVYIGPTGISTSTGHELGIGETWCGNVGNANEVFVIAAANSTSTVSWVGTN